MSNKPEIFEGSLDELKPLSDNPMKHGKRNRESITNSIKEYGFSRSIVAHKNDDESITILAGHGTLDSSREAGLEKVVYVPVDGKTVLVALREGLTEEEQYLLAIADNQAGKLATFDGEAIENIRDKRGVDITKVLTDKEIEALTKKKKKEEDKPPAFEDDGQTFGERGYYIILEFDDKDERDNLFDEFVDEGFKVVKYEADKRGGENGKGN